MRRVLAMDLGGTKLAASLRAGQSRVTTRIPLHETRTAETELDRLLDVLGANLGLRPGCIARAALACAPSLDPHGVVVEWPSRPSWVGLPLRERLELAIGCALETEDDGNAAALAEARARRLDDLVYLGIGTGVGGGIVLSGRLYRGSGMNAGSLGHLSLLDSGPRCACGRRGCLQAFASGPAVLRRAFASRRSATSVELREALGAGDEAARTALEEAASALARAILLVVRILDPMLVVLGGGFADAVPELRLAVVDALAKREHTRRVEVAPPIYGADSSLAGAELIASA